MAVFGFTCPESSSSLIFLAVSFMWDDVQSMAVPTVPQVPWAEEAVLESHAAS